MKRENALELRRAFQYRAGVIGVLSTCICGYPLVRYLSPTLHRESCPSRIMIEAQPDLMARGLLEEIPVGLDGFFRNNSPRKAGAR